MILELKPVLVTEWHAVRLEDVIAGGLRDIVPPVLELAHKPVHFDPPEVKDLGRGAVDGLLDSSKDAAQANIVERRRHRRDLFAGRRSRQVALSPADTLGASQVAVDIGRELSPCGEMRLPAERTRQLTSTSMSRSCIIIGRPSWNAMTLRSTRRHYPETTDPQATHLSKLYTLHQTRFLVSSLEPLSVMSNSDPGEVIPESVRLLLRRPVTVQTQLYRHSHRQTSKMPRTESMFAAKRIHGEEEEGLNRGDR